MIKKSLPRTKPEQDPRLFMVFMSVIVATVYIITLVNTPSLHNPAIFLPLTLLLILHLSLHWLLEYFSENHARLLPAYIILQGILAFILVLVCNQSSLLFALYLALIGEGIGLFGISRAGILTVGYYFALSMTNFGLIMGWNQIGSWALVTILMVIWVGIYVMLYMRQHEARQKAQSLLAELESANTQLREYSARVEDLTIANERQRMARELHDTLSQGLAGLILQLEAADAHLASNRPEKARAIVQQTMEHARTTLSDARRAIDDLRQSNPVDLESALRLEASRFENATGIPCIFQADLSHPVPDYLTEALTRLTTEALTNIARHAQANQAWVILTCSETNINVKINDNGKGFDPSNVASGHYGIIGMQERVRLLGGTLNIQSSPEKGTLIEIDIPFQTIELTSPNIP